MRCLHVQTDEKPVGICRPVLSFSENAPDAIIGKSGGAEQRFSGGGMRMAHVGGWRKNDKGSKTESGGEGKVFRVVEVRTAHVGGWRKNDKGSGTESSGEGKVFRVMEVRMAHIFAGGE